MATEERETAGLIGSDKVEGTNVYGATGEKIGSIERVMIDKRSGQVAYAVLRFGGFLGIGSDYYPIPWTSYHLSTPICQFLPHLHDWLTTNSACIIAGAMTQHGYKHTQQSVANIA